MTAGAVDADGNVTPSVQIEQQAHAHQPVTKTMPVDDYMEIGYILPGSIHPSHLTSEYIEILKEFKG